jgi:hypothetical protein
MPRRPIAHDLKPFGDGFVPAHETFPQWASRVSLVGNEMFVAGLCFEILNAFER